mmetsp:Transcript_7409/g.13757  ORF Transcript_7409/g.13757 Transcript_7409/m.13757 type:complete len:221 (+) Transcript_7409:28-690(+)
MIASSPPHGANTSRDATDCAADEWVQLALREYEQVASLCNAQSLLGNAAAAAPSPTPATDGRNHDIDDGERDLDQIFLTGDLQRKKLHDQLSGYYQALDSVRKTHASLKKQLSSISKLHDDDVAKSHDDGSEHRVAAMRRRPPSAVVEALSRHVELTERVIRTVMMQSSPQNKNGPCGVLFGNGIVRSSSSASDHEVNIVALASLRASVSRLKTSYGGVG